MAPLQDYDTPIIPITTHSGVWQLDGTDRLAGLVWKILKKELLKFWVVTSLLLDQLFQFFNTECV